MVIQLWYELAKKMKSTYFNFYCRQQWNNNPGYQGGFHNNATRQLFGVVLRVANKQKQYAGERW
jgi:hypothetical protein